MLYISFAYTFYLIGNKEQTKTGTKGKKKSSKVIRSYSYVRLRYYYTIFHFNNRISCRKKNKKPKKKTHGDCTMSYMFANVHRMQYANEKIASFAAKGYAKEIQL